MKMKKSRRYSVSGGPASGIQYWSGDALIAIDRDLVAEAERLPESDSLTKEDTLAVGRLMTHIIPNGAKLSEKDEWEWRTCGILKEGFNRGKKRLCIDLFWCEEDEDDDDLDWKLAIMLKDRKLRCVPNTEGKFVFHVNTSYEEYKEQMDKDRVA
jgi:hypothetical protein